MALRIEIKGLQRIEIKGLQQMQRAMAQLGTKAPQALARALYVEAEEIMGRSKAEFVPVDTDALRASGAVLPPQIHGQQVSVELGFHTPYALIQHENLDYFHAVGQAKYLQIPLLEAANTMPQRLAARLKAERLAG